MRWFLTQHSLAQAALHVRMCVRRHGQQRRLGHHLGLQPAHHLRGRRCHACAVAVGAVPWNAVTGGPALHCSAGEPGQTDGLPLLTGYVQDLDAANITWRNYFELIPTSWQFQYTRTKLENYNLFEQFAIDAANGNLASYSACLAPLCLFGVAVTCSGRTKCTACQGSSARHVVPFCVRRMNVGLSVFVCVRVCQRLSTRSTMIFSGKRAPTEPGLVVVKSSSTRVDGLMVSARVASSLFGPRDVTIRWL